MKFLGHTGKMIVVGVLVIICWVASLFVLGVVSEREGRQSEAEAQVAEDWGRPQVVAGPVLVIPTTKSIANPHVPSVVTQQVLYILPKDLSIESEIKPEVRKRGIFSAPVYRTKLNFSGSFTPINFIELGVNANQVLWDKATLMIGLSDTRSVDATSAKFDGREIKFAPGAELWSVNGMGVHAPVYLIPGSGEHSFSFELDLSGSKGISFLPLGDVTKVSAQAPWGSPSFTGAFLPDTEELSKDNFSAAWQVSSLGRSYPSAWVGSGNGMINNEYSQALAASTFGVDLFREVTFYTLVSRTVKYAILFIALTFLAFYLFEVTSGIKIHPFQYILIGAALVLFYLLLLSISEHIGFGRSYLISSIMTLGLVTTYSASVLKARSRAWIVATILAILYAYLYAILQLEQFALLFGTLFLFVALAAVMYTTRKIEWYKELG